MTTAARRRPQRSSAPPGDDRRAGRDRHGHRARGDRATRLRRTASTPDPARTSRIAGSAVTVSCHPGDNLMIHAAVEVCEPGDVLVVTNTAPSTHGMFGDLLAGSLMARGVRGLVIDAGVRDTARAAGDGLPRVVAARVVRGHGEGVAGLGQRAGRARRPASSSRATSCAPTTTAWSSCPRAEADEALALGQARIAKEAASRERLDGGELGVDIYGLRTRRWPPLGVEYVDTIADLDSLGGTLTMRIRRRSARRAGSAIAAGWRPPASTSAPTSRPHRHAGVGGYEALHRSPSSGMWRTFGCGQSVPHSTRSGAASIERRGANGATSSYGRRTAGRAAARRPTTSPSSARRGPAPAARWNGAWSSPARRRRRRPMWSMTYGHRHPGRAGRRSRRGPWRRSAARRASRARRRGARRRQNSSSWGAPPRWATKLKRVPRTPASCSVGRARHR